MSTAQHDSPDPRPDRDTPDPEVLAGLVQRCPAVAGLAGGRFGEVATYLPGRRVRGVRIGPGPTGEVEIHVVGRYPNTTVTIAAQVRAAVTPQTGGRAVTVAIDDLALPGEPDPDDALVHDQSLDPGPSADLGPSGDAAPCRPRPPAPSFPPPTTSPAGTATPGADSPSRRLDTKEPPR